MNTEFINHCEIKFSDCLEIVDLKNKVWPYPFESQIKWIKDNIHPEDIHLILKENGSLMGYLNLCKVIVGNNNQNDIYWGIGNVCVDPLVQGKGLGNIIIKEANQFILNSKSRGILICKDRLVSFYARHNWQIVQNAIYYNNEIINFNGINVMIFPDNPFKENNAVEISRIF